MSATTPDTEPVLVERHRLAHLLDIVPDTELIGMGYELTGETADISYRIGDRCFEMYIREITHDLCDPGCGCEVQS